MPYRKPNLPDVPTLSEATIKVWRRDRPPNVIEQERYERELAMCCAAIKERAARLGIVHQDDSYFSGKGTTR